jgi:RNA-binding protein
MAAEISKQKLKEMKSKAMLLKPMVRIGKAGLTDGLIKEINNHLKKKKLIKVKFLKSFMESKEKKQAVQELVEKTNSVLVRKVGFTATLYRAKVT